MTATLETVTCVVPNLTEVPGYEATLGGLTMPETVVALRATSWLHEQKGLTGRDRELVESTATALAHNVREISKHACAVTARTDFTDIAVPEHPFAFDFVVDTVDFSAVATRIFPNDEAPTVVSPPQISMLNYAETEMLFLRAPKRQAEVGPDDPASPADESASIPIAPVQDSPDKAVSSPSAEEITEANVKISRSLAAETKQATLIVLDRAQQRIVRYALKRLIQNDKETSPHDLALARAAMEIPALAGIPSPREARSAQKGYYHQILGRLFALLAHYGSWHSSMKHSGLLQ